MQDLSAQSTKLCRSVHGLTGEAVVRLGIHSSLRRLDPVRSAGEGIVCDALRVHLDGVSNVLALGHAEHRVSLLGQKGRCGTHLYRPCALIEHCEGSISTEASCVGTSKLSAALTGFRKCSWRWSTNSRTLRSMFPLTAM